MKPETVVCNYLAPKMRSLCPVRVELSTGELGFPDFALVTGLMEVKQVDAWPVNKETIVQFPLFTGDQRKFLRRWKRSGGRCWVFVRVGQRRGPKWHLLFDGGVAARMLGRCCTQTMIDMALAWWGPRDPVEDEDPKLMKHLGGRHAEVRGPDAGREVVAVARPGRDDLASSE